MTYWPIHRSPSMTLMHWHTFTDILWECNAFTFRVKPSFCTLQSWRSMLDLKDEYNKLFQKAGNYLPVDKTCHPRETAQYVYSYLVIESEQLLKDLTSWRQFQSPCKFLVRDLSTFIGDNMWRLCEYFFFNICLGKTEREIMTFL